MSLNIWSLIVFASHALFYLALTVALLSKSSIIRLLIMVVAWLTYQIITLWYGIATHQLGFILIGIFQFVVSVATIIATTERNINENI